MIYEHHLSSRKYICITQQPRTMKNIALLFTTVWGILIMYNPTLQAQNHELSVYAGGGLSTLNTDMTSVFDIDNTHKAGGMVGIGYVYNFSEQFAIQTGVEAALYQSRYKLNEINGNYVMSLPSGESVKLDYMLEGYSEKAKATYISIPIMVRFRLPISASFKWSAAAGTKLGMAAHSKYKNSYSTLQTSGVIVSNGELVETDPIVDLPEQGFGTYTYGNDKGDLKLAIMCTLSAETGVAYSINKRYSVYAGIYMDYALNDTNKKRNRSFVQYNEENPAKPTVNGMLNSVNKRNLEAISLAKNMRPTALGMKVQFIYHF